MSATEMMSRNNSENNVILTVMRHRMVNTLHMD